MSIADKMTTIAENVPKVYEAGKKAQEDYFWSKYMNPPADMSYRFAGLGWYPGIFKPTTDMKPTTSASRMFAAFNYYNRGGQTFDLVEHLKNLGVTLDFSGCVNMQECFGSAHITRIGVMDIRKSSNKYGIFSTDWLETIDELIVDEKYVFNSIFASSSKLTNLKITGTIGQNGFSVSPCKNLTHDSLMSIINALQDKTTDTSGTTWKVTLGSTNVAKLTTEELAQIEAKGWTYA